MYATYFCHCMSFPLLGIHCLLPFSWWGGYPLSRTSRAHHVIRMLRPETMPSHHSVITIVDKFLRSMLWSRQKERMHPLQTLEANEVELLQPAGSERIAVDRLSGKVRDNPLMPLPLPPICHHC